MSHSHWLIGALVALLVIPFTATAQSSAPAAEATINIPYTQYTLDNGLTLIVHQDTKAPIVAVNVWYHVGSKNEPDGRSGFAHLFEHLMFNGTEHYDDEYFAPFEQVGATDMNGTTNQDRTNYFQNVSKNALDLALWMESDRMGHLLGAITQDKLDEQRGVVQNEKRQGENQPYGQVYNRIIESVYPQGHPYDHTVIGSMEDLNAATLDDVKEWFETYYGPNNATIVIAGDIEPKVAYERVQHYFGDIPPADPTHTYKAWVAKRTGEQREVMQDRVPQARLHMVWNVPEWAHADADHLNLVSDILGSGKTSRLYERLVYTDQVATDANAYIQTGEIGSLFVIRATARPGEDLTAVEQAVREELDRFLTEGPTAAEVQRVQTQYRAGFVRGVERIGGFGGKSDILAESQVYGGRPDFYQTQLERVANATPDGLQQAAQDWLSDGVYILEVHPYPELSAQGAGADRSGLPEVADFPDASFPELQRATLSNGLEIVLAERSSVPLVEFDLLVDAGYASDQLATPGTASLAMNVMDEGTATRSSLEISEALDNLGANLSTGSNLDVSIVALSALKENLAPSLDLFADVILNPAFPEQEFARLQREQLARIQREKQTPVQMALRVFPGLLYGEGHAYSNPLTGSGTEAMVTALTRDDLARFHATWFKPNNATLVVAGDITMDELRPMLESRFDGWDAGDVPQKNIASVDVPQQETIYLLDRPGSAQSIIFAGHVAPPKANPDEFAIQSMNSVLGGTFTSRVNMNLREDKGWSYGAFTLMLDAEGPRPFIAYAPVQTDQTAPSMQELRSELQGITSAAPVTDDELAKTKNEQTLTLPGQFETISAVGSAVGEIVRFGLPDDYYDTFAENVRGLTLTDLNAAAQDVVRPDGLVWVVVGDREVIEPSIRALGFGEVRLMSENGQPLSVRTE